MFSMNSVLVWLALLRWSDAVFMGAPGTITVSLKSPLYVEDCMGKDCKYVAEVCVGSGRSENEKCLWSPFSKFTDNLSTSKYLVNITFDVDDVQSSFYFNGNISFFNDNAMVRIDHFKDSMFRFKEVQTIYSTDFTSLTMEMQIKCKPSFYPKNKCSVNCFDNAPVHVCDETGMKICSKGYVLDSTVNQCVSDFCSRDQHECQNNGTCFNVVQGPRCKCADEFSGDSCETWDPCQKHQCKNGGYCIKRKAEHDYICQCSNQFYGKYCENRENPCFSTRCGDNGKCEIVDNVAKCITIKSKPITKKPFTTLVTERTILKAFSTTAGKKEKPENIQIERETVRLVQYHPIRNEYTTLAIIMVLVVFMLGSFGIVFWVLKLKYSQKKNKSFSQYPTLPVLPSIFNTTSTYRSSDDHFRRWRSLDDNSFYVCNQYQEGYHPYRTGSHIWPKQDQNQEQFRDNYPSLNSQHRMCHSMVRTRMPRLCEPSTLNSSDLNFDGTNQSQNNSEKIDDYTHFVGSNEPEVIDI